MPNEITFRRLTADDIPDYRRLRLECLKDFPENFASVYQEQLKLPKMYMETVLEGEDVSKFLVGAFSQGVMIGLVAVIREDNSRMRHVAHILQMYVQPLYSGQKVGIKMLNFAVTCAWEIEGLEQLRLEVVTTSQSAIHVYQTAGFEEIGLYRQQMKIGKVYKDAIAMVLFRSASKTTN